MSFCFRAKTLSCDKIHGRYWHPVLFVLLSLTLLKTFENDIFHLHYLSRWTKVWWILSRQRAKKTFVWLQTTFAWKVKWLFPVCKLQYKKAFLVQYLNQLLYEYCCSRIRVLTKNHSNSISKWAQSPHILVEDAVARNARQCMLWSK